MSSISYLFYRFYQKDKGSYLYESFFQGAQKEYVRHRDYDALLRLSLEHQAQLYVATWVTQDPNLVARTIKIKPDESLAIVGRESTSQLPQILSIYGAERPASYLKGMLVKSGLERLFQKPGFSTHCEMDHCVFYLVFDDFALVSLQSRSSLIKQLKSDFYIYDWESDKFYPENLSAEVFTLFKSVKNKLSDNPSVIESSLGRRKYLVSGFRNEPLKITVFSYVSKDDAFKPINRQFVQIGVTAIIAIMVSLGLIYAFVGPIKNLFNQLTTAMLQFQKTGQAPVLEISGDDDLAIISRTFNQMLKKIDQLLLEKQEQARMEAELVTAREVQSTVLPRKSWSLNGSYLRGFYRSASECGGDMWYYVVNKGQIYILLADVTGHGVSAALITSVLRAGLPLMCRDQNLTLEQMMGRLNELVFEAAGGLKMATAVLMSYEWTTRKIKYCVAAHELPVLIRKKSSGKFTKKDLEFLGAEGAASPRLGQSSESSYTTYERILEPHTAILIYTDGLTDCQNAEGTSFGERQLHKILVDCANHQIKSTYGRLETTILEFMGKNQPDDITFVVLYVE